MIEPDVLDLLQRANLIRVEDLPDPRESPVARELLDSIVGSGEPLRPARAGAGGLIHRHRVGVAAAALAATTAVAVAVAVFPRSSVTSTGLAKVSNRGRPAAFVHPHSDETPYILAEHEDKVFFRVARSPRVDEMFPGLAAGYPCWGEGRLVDGKIEVLRIDCTPFPAPGRSVLDAEAMDASNGTGTFLFIDGFAADGVAKVRLVDRQGAVVAEAPVEGNVFSLPGVGGVTTEGTSLQGIDPRGHEVWRRDDHG